MAKSSQIARDIDKKLSQRTSTKKPVTLSLNEDSYKRVQSHCEEFNKKIDEGKVAGRKINVSSIIDELLAQYLNEKN